MKVSFFSGMLQAILVAVAVTTVHVNAALDSGVYDLLKERYHGVTFLEIGYFFLDSQTWVYTTATFTNFTDPVVFLSLPDIAGELHSDGYPAIPRIRNIDRDVKGHDFSVTSFEAKIYLANDSFCSKNFYTPVPIDPPLSIVWMVVERGAWDLDGDEFYANTGLIYRLDHTYEEYNYPKLFNAKKPNGDVAGFSSSVDVGAVTQLQTLLYDRFLLIRGRTIFRNAVKLLLVPHDSTVESYYRLVNPNETVAFMLFKSGYAITCKEKLTLESRLYNMEVNEVRRVLSFQNTFLRPPGVFGMIQSTLGQDSVGLRVFDRTNNSAAFITQEDQCYDADTSHTTAESVAVLIAGQISFLSELVCNVVFDNPRPTAFPTEAPTAAPTFSPTSLPTTASPTLVPTAQPTLTPTGSPTVEPSIRPTFDPSVIPTAVPTPVPSANPTVAPTTIAPTLSPTTLEPTSEPSATPTRVPTPLPTLRPTAEPSTATPTGSPTLEPANHTEVVMLMRGNFDMLWEGPLFFVASTSNSSLYVGEPDIVENPKVRAFLPREGGLYVFTSGYESNPDTIDTHDLKCKVYWSVSIHNITSNSTVTFEGTYNSTLALNYQYTTAVWTVQFEENMLYDGYVPCVPSSAPTATPTAIPTAIPTATPTAVPTTNAPTAAPTVTPTPVPTAIPTLAPTKANNTNVDLHLLASNGDTWSGVELFIQSVDEEVLYRKAPNATNGNPLDEKFLPLTSGIYVISAVLPPNVSAANLTEDDLKCQVYWEFNISRSQQIFYGTYNTTLVFQYEYFKDSWVLLYSENEIRRYTPCFPSAAPTLRPSRYPTLFPTQPPTFMPTKTPTRRPTRFPTFFPTKSPTRTPTLAPTRFPTRQPTPHPTAIPTPRPTSRPTFQPTRVPTEFPTLPPTFHPTTYPSGVPTGEPSKIPTAAPTYNASRVLITMMASYAESWSGVKLVITGPDTSVLLQHPGPDGMGIESYDFYPEGDGNYTFTAHYERWIPDFTDPQKLRCEIYFMLNFTDSSLDTVVHGTYETSVTLHYDWSDDDWAVIASKGTLDAYNPCTPTPNPTVSPTLFNGNGGTYDMIANRYVVQPWMEIGYTVLDDRNWVSITGSFTNFHDPVVFLSLPNIDGETSNTGYSAAARVNNVVVSRTSTYYSEVSWDAKIFLTNDSYCSKKYYTPQHVDPPVAVSWMIAERGAWNLSSRFFFVDKGPITRIDDSYFLYNMMRQENPYECDAYDAPCKFPDYITVGNIGAITQIQTLVYDRFLLVRAYALNRKQGLYLLTPHDAADPSYYVMSSPETMAYMHFQGGVSITCRESVTIETSLHYVTHFKEVVRYNHNFTVPPGVFGMVASVVGQDSVGLRAFDRSNNGAAFITQEDKCYDKETNHTSEEFVSIFVAGSVTESSDFKCDIIHDYKAPSTFRDNGGTYDMIHKRYIDDIWMEIGYTALDGEHWSTVTTTFQNFTDPVVFLSLPDIEGETSGHGYPAIGRLRNVEVTRHSDDNATTSFQAKLYLANDSYCSKQWYTPQHIWPPIPTSWMVAERGAWNLSSNFFFVETANIYRDDETYNDYNFVSVNHPTGCTSQYVQCQFPDDITVDRLGAITQLQTLVYDRFLLVRGFSITRKSGRYLLTPHDSVEVTYYELWESETMGFMHYHDNVRLNCKEALTIETQIFRERVTNIKLFLPYSNEFKRPPGVFGQIMTTIGRDSVGLRAFNRSKVGSHFITQEDQCLDEETDHTSAETVSLFIAGSLPEGTNSATNFTCNMRFTESKFVENGGTFDLVKDEYASQPWMEFGNTNLDDTSFVTISSSFKNFYDPVVFLSLPDIHGETSNLGYPAIGRVKDVFVNRTSSVYSEVSFQAKLFLANDSACSSEWYTPQHISPALPVSWLIAERGAWNLSDHFFFVNSGPITREDHTYESYNMKRLFNVPGCNQFREEDPCGFPAYVPTSNFGMIGQLQTIVYDRFLLVRGFQLNRKAGLYLLTPHDSIDLNYYVLTTPETIGFIHFSSGASLSCREQVTVETSLHYVTHIKVTVPYFHNFTSPPGVFGMVSSVIGQDSVGLRAFNRNLGSSSFITQEDQCSDLETQHTSSELVSILLTGAVSATSTLKCDFVLWSPETKAPTLAPTPPLPSPTRSPTLVSQFATSYPSTVPEFVTNVPTKTGQFHTEIPTVPGQWETSRPTRVEQYHSNGPTTESQLVTAAPTIFTKFHTEAPTTPAQFVTQAPTIDRKFVTEGPTAVNQFRTNVPSQANALYTHIPTIASQFETQSPTRTTQYHTNSPNWRGSAKPSEPSGFFTEAPTRVSQYETRHPTRSSQFVTRTPTSPSQFQTGSPSTLSNFYSFVPTRTSQFQTSGPTLSSQHTTAGPTTSSQFTTRAPTPSAVFSTRTPTTTEQFSTATPTLVGQFISPNPTLVSQHNTNAPTLTSQFHTRRPTTINMFKSEHPTLSSQFVSNVPTTADEFHTEHPSRVVQHATRNPTTVGQFVSQAPTISSQFSTSAPTPTAQFHTNIPTLVSQHRIDDFVSNAPTIAAQFTTPVPTPSSQLHTRHPSTTLQFRTPQPSLSSKFVTNYPTITEQFVTHVPTLSGQFHTSIPTKTIQYKTRFPTPTDAHSTRYPTQPSRFATHTPTLVTEFHTSIPTKPVQYHTEHPTKTEQYPPSLLPPATPRPTFRPSSPTSRPTGTTSTSVSFDAFTDIYNSDCAYWLSTAGRVVFKRGIIATQPSTPQALQLEDISITGCVVVTVGRRLLRGQEDNERRSLQVTAPRVLWRIDTFIEYFGYTNGTKYFLDFQTNFFNAVSNGIFIGAMQEADPSLTGITTGSSDTTFGPYASESQTKSNGVAAESKKYFWPILIAALFLCFCCFFLLLFLCIKRRKEKDAKTAPSDSDHATIATRETTILPQGERVELVNKQSSRHQVRVRAEHNSSPAVALGRGRVLTPGAAKSYKDFTGLAPFYASEKDYSENLQTWIISLQQSDETYREKLDLDPRDDEPSLISLLTLPRLTDDQIDLLMDFAEELYADCENLFARLNGVVETHGSMKFGRIRQTKYTTSESPMPSPPRPNTKKSIFL